MDTYSINTSLAGLFFWAVSSSRGVRVLSAHRGRLSQFDTVDHAGFAGYMVLQAICNTGT